MCEVTCNYFCPQNMQQFVEMCLQLVVENCYQADRNANMTVIEIASRHEPETLAPVLKTALSYYSQVEGVLSAALIYVSVIYKNCGV
jgi:hypothetical protein